MEHNSVSDTGGEGRSVEGESALPEARLEDAIAFLRRVRPAGPWTLTAILPERDSGPTHTATFGPDTADKALAWLEARSGLRNLYWMVNTPMRPLTKKAERADVKEMVALWVDIDPKKGEDPAAARAAAIARLETYRRGSECLKPSIVIDSGGGVQAFWLLDEPLPIDGHLSAAEEAARYNQQLEKDLKGDSCHNLDRVMRLPGTINLPGKEKREKGRKPRLASLLQFHDGLTYPLADFTLASPRNVAPTTGQATVQLEGVPPPLASLDELPAAVTPRTRMLIVQGCDPDEPDRYPSRSEALFAVCCELARAGCDDKVIAAVILDPAFGISESVIDKEGQALRYAEHQIARARDAVAKDGLGPGGRRVLNPHAPFEIAELLKAELFPSAIHTNDDWLEYRAGAYRDVEDATVRSVLYRELNEALVQKITDDGVEFLPFNPDTTKVNKVQDALEGVAHQPADTMAPPVWLDGVGPPPLEIVACRNGLLHVPTGELLPPTPRFFTRNALDLDFDPNAPEPEEWLAFVRQVQPDPVAAELLQDWFGYLLLPDTSQHKILLMKGPTRSGKGVTQQIITQLVGEGNTCNPRSSSLGGKNVGALQPLIGKTVAFISDARFGGSADKHAIAETLLTISGGDNVTIDRKFKAAWTGRLPTRFVMLSNELPSLKDNSPALANRFVPLIFEESFLGREDRELASRIIRSEMPGVLNWALAGWRRLRERGHFVLPRASTDAITEIMELGSDVAAFVRDRCELRADRSVDKNRLFGAWQDWCRVNDISPGRANHFARNLFDATNQKVRATRPSVGGERFNVFEGIGLIGGDDPPY